MESTLNMKKVRIVVLLLGILAFVPATSYALFDIGVYGNYAYKGEIKSDTPNVNNPDPTGFSYGVIGHYNQGIFPFIRSGIGLYSQYSKLSFSTGSGDVEYGKKIVGIDLYLQLDIPLIPLHPYVKFASGIWEDYTGDMSQASAEYFNTYQTGGGVALTFFPFLQFFGEYQYLYTKSVDEDKAIGHAVAMGLRLFF